MTGREPDLEIAAAVRAAEVRFQCKPQVRVDVYSDTPASAEHVCERHNLPDTLEPGITYSDFAVRWRVAAYLEDPDSPHRDGDPAEAK